MSIREATKDYQEAEKYSSWRTKWFLVSLELFLPPTKHKIIVFIESFQSLSLQPMVGVRVKAFLPLCIAFHLSLNGGTFQTPLASHTVCQALRIQRWIDFDTSSQGAHDLSRRFKALATQCTKSTIEGCRSKRWGIFSGLFTHKMPDSFISDFLTSLHLTSAFRMHPLVLNQQDQVQTSRVRE